MRDLCQHIMDLVENAAAAGARAVTITLREEPEADRLALAVEDDGRGMSAEDARQAADPFFTTRSLDSARDRPGVGAGRQVRRVGLGLSLLQAAAERAGGAFDLESEPGRGTRVECSFALSNVDTPPLGDVATTLAALVALHPELRLRYEHDRAGRRFCLDTAELGQALGDDIALSSPAAASALRRQLTRAWEAFVGPPPGAPADRELAMTDCMP